MSAAAAVVVGNILTPSGFVHGSIAFTPEGRIGHIHGKAINEEAARTSTELRLLGLGKVATGAMVLRLDQSACDAYRQ